MPRYEWSARPLQFWLCNGIPASPADYSAWRRCSGRRFFFEALDKTALSRFGDLSIERAKAVLEGTQLYFGGLPVQCGFPPDWHRDAMNSVEWPRYQHWSRISDGECGDIKLAWEPNRFSVVYTLARAYARSKDETFAEGFWTLTEDWIRHNIPQCGINWKCGQETAIRLMAWVFGLYAFAEAEATTADRIAQLAEAIASQAERIEGNLFYGRHQNNNHAISEGLGLWTIGLLFPEFRHAERWRCKGRRTVEEAMERQIYEDGSYVQHSANYHRVMLQALVWYGRLAELNDDPLPPRLLARIGRAVDFLYQVTDLSDGLAPNYGHNDGALLRPLTDCDYRDHRPALQAAAFLVHRRALLERGPWDEEGFWLFGERALTASRAGAEQASSVFENGGCYTLRGEATWGMLRCQKFRDRPAHADQLHLDLWWRGDNVACDAGTYLYGGEGVWENGLTESAVHNTVTLDGRPQMLRASRFLWLNWASGKLLRYERQGDCELVEGEHDGFLSNGVLHRRAVLRVKEAVWVIVDDLLGMEVRRARLQWLFPDGEWQLQYDCPTLRIKTGFGLIEVRLWCSQVHALDLVRAGETLKSSSGSADPYASIRGWRSLYYAKKQPALSLSMESQAALPVRFVSVVVLGEETGLSRLDGKRAELLSSKGSSSVHFAGIGSREIISIAATAQNME